MDKNEPNKKKRKKDPKPQQPPPYQPTEGQGGNPIKCSFFYLPSPLDQKLFFK